MNYPIIEQILWRLDQWKKWDALSRLLPEHGTNGIDLADGSLNDIFLHTGLIKFYLIWKKNLMFD